MRNKCHASTVLCPLSVTYFCRALQSLVIVIVLSVMHVYCDKVAETRIIEFLVKSSSVPNSFTC